MEIGIGQDRDSIVKTMNKLTQYTGVYARANGRMMTEKFGSDQNFDIELIELRAGPPPVFLGEAVAGRDAVATANGQELVVEEGIILHLDNASMSGQVSLLPQNDSRQGDINNGTYDFILEKSGMKFQLGSETLQKEQDNIGIKNMHSSNLGKQTMSNLNLDSGYLSTLKSGEIHSLAKDPENAANIIDWVIDDVSEVRAFLGGFQKNTLEATMNNLKVTIENLSDSESRVRDADYAHEIVEKTRRDLLTKTATSMMSQSNMSTQHVIQLIGP